MSHPNAKIFRNPVTSITIGILLIICLFPGETAALHFNFRNYSIEDGLPQSQVMSLLQDSQGYLWIGTYGGGVGRFNGNTFKNFSTKDGLSDNVISSILEDRDGNIWFCTDNGLNRYDGNKFQVYPQKNGFPNDFIRTILQTRDGSIWIGTYNKGIYRFHRETFTPVTKKNGLLDDRVRSLFQGPDGKLWIGTQNGLCIYDGKTFLETPLTERLKGQRISCIMQDRDRRIWTGTRDGLFLLDGKNIRRFTKEENQLCSNVITAIIQDRNGRFWIATDKGLNYYDGKRFIKYTQDKGLIHNFVHCLLEDREGNIWIGTDYGLSQFRGKMFSYIGVKDGLKNNVVWSFFQANENEIYIGTEKGIDIYNKKDHSVIHHTDREMQGYVLPQVPDRKGHLWFGNMKKLFRYDGKKYIDYNKIYNLKDINVFWITESTDDRIWVGTEIEGLLMFKNDTFQQFKMKEGDDGLTDNGITYITEDKRGNLWIGSNNGINVYDGKKFRKFGTNETWLNSRYINTILTDNEGNIWIATYGAGLIKHTPAPGGKIGEGTFANITTDDGLTDNEIQLMIFDDHGNLWLGTNKGLTRLDVEEFNRTGKKRLRHYGKADGFTGIECNQNAAYKDWDGKLWFGTIKGAVCCDPKEEVENSVEPNILFTSLKLFHEETDWSLYSATVDNTGRTKKPRSTMPVILNLAHTENHLTFEYIAISLTVPEKVRYQVKLEGFDRHWLPTTATYYTYSNLPAGNFTFKVKACNSSGVWTREPKAYSFTIRRAIWQTWWFYMLIALFFLGSGVAVYKIRVRRLKKRQHQLEEKVKEHTLALNEEKQKVEEINQRLEQRVEERTRRLAAANRKLIRAQKLEVIGTLAGGVAHDLNNVLAGLVSYPELLLLRMNEEDNLRKYVYTIKKSGEKAAAIVQDLLSLARRSISVSDIINLNHVIREFFDSPEYNKILSYHPHIGIQLQLDPLLPNLSGSPVHLSKALMNLVANAAEAMPAEGEITVKTYSTILNAPPEGYEEVERGEYVVLEVSDTGIGIAPGDIDHIFEPFFTKKKLGRSGTGLGMAVVWGTVEDHHGYIAVKSTQGKGTHFYLYFPASHEKLSAHADHFFSIANLKGQGQSILVVDDVEEQKEAASLMLEQLGYAVHAVSSGEEAVNYLKKQPVDLLVLDMIMEPGMNGLETFKRIIDIYPHQKALIVSGYSETKDAKEVERLAQGRFLKKPFGLQQIGAAVKECFEGDD